MPYQVNFPRQGAKIFRNIINEIIDLRSLFWIVAMARQIKCADLCALCLKTGDQPPPRQGIAAKAMQ